MSVHEQFADDLALYALGTLEGRDRAALQAHLAQCSACRRELQQLCGDMGLLGLATIGPTPPPAARARLLSALAKEPRVRMVRKRSLRWWLLMPLGATIVLAVLSLLLWRENNALRKDLSQRLAQSSQNQAEVERAREVLALLNAGAYSFSQMFAYNGRPLPAAVLVRQGGKAEVIRRRDSYEDLLFNEVW